MPSTKRLFASGNPSAVRCVQSVGCHRVPGDRQLAEPMPARGAETASLPAGWLPSPASAAGRRTRPAARAGPTPHPCPQQVVDRLARHVAVDQRLQQPLRQLRRPPQHAGFAGQRRALQRAAASSSTQLASRPSSSLVPSTITPAAASWAAWSPPCRQHLRRRVLPQHTLAARTITGRRPASSKPPRSKRQRRAGRAAAPRPPGPDRSRGPAPARPDALGRSRASSSIAVTGLCAVAEVDHERIGRLAAAAAPAVAAIQLSIRRSRFGLVVPRVGIPSARARPAASRGCLVTGSILPDARFPATRTSPSRR